MYFETFSSISNAISREKQLKNWKSPWKDAVVSKDNRDWKDHSKTIGVDEELIADIKTYIQEIADQVRNDHFCRHSAAPPIYWVGLDPESPTNNNRQSEFWSS